MLEFTVKVANLMSSLGTIPYQHESIEKKKKKKRVNETLRFAKMETDYYLDFTKLMLACFTGLRIIKK